MDTSAENGPEQLQSSNYRWVIITAWMVSHVFGFVVLESLGLLLPSINRDFHLSPIEEGFLGAAPRIGTIFMAIPAGWWLSKFSPKRLTTFTLVVGVLLILFQGWAPFFLLLLLARFLFGISLIAREPARALLIRQWVLPREVVIINAFGNMLWGVTAIGLLLTPFVLEMLDDDWRATFYVFAAVAFVLAVAWQALGKERNSPQYLAAIQSQERSPIGSIFKYKEIWIIGVGMMGTAITWSSFATFWPTFMLEQYDVSVKTSAIMMATSGVVSSFAGIGVGVLSNMVGKRRVILWWTGIVLVATQIGILWTGAFTPLVLISVVNGFGWSYFPITLSIPFQLPDIKPREIAVTIGFVETVLYIGAFIGPIMTGVIEELSGNLRAGLMVVSVTSLAMSVSAVLLPKKWDRVILEAQPAAA